VARTRLRRHLRTLALAELALLMTLAVPSALAETARATLSVSAPIVYLGDRVHLSGSVTGDPGCNDERPVTLQWQPADSAGFTTIGGGTTTGDGAFAFDASQPQTGQYRGLFPENGACLAATTNLVLVRVREMVDAAFDDVVRLRVRGAQAQPNETSSSPVLRSEVTAARWMDAITRAIGDRAVSAAIGQDGVILYHHEAQTPRRPASNEKLLLAMTMYDTFGADFRIPTSVAVAAGETGEVQDLWILGQGDPTVDDATMGALAHDLVDAGITRVQGRIVGATDYFARDWDAPGWHEDARDYVNRPTALTFEGNRDADPERDAAKALTRRLEDLGVHVDGTPTRGDPPEGLETIAVERSASLQRLSTKMLRPSDNFMAETLGKRLGAETALPGTIAKGAAALQGWTDAHGIAFRLHDSSGLSYGDRVTAHGIVRLLSFAEDQPWGLELRAALPTGGQGTLVNRLHGIDVRAKTGTLDDVSALSGWVKTGPNEWTEFSILSRGLSKWTASGIEDRIVEILDRRL
jgi:serine-type D-Ala-D-Ala carboxypeptidase/endopeptidase (penicillin-binding protein 4)